MTETHNLSDEDCEGCHVKPWCEDEGNPYYKEKYGIECPCTMCIVKVMCEVPCTPYVVFVSKVHNYNLEQNHERTKNKNATV